MLCCRPKSVRTVIPQNQDEEVLMEEFQLITTKPVLYVCNVDEGSAALKTNMLNKFDKR